MERTCCYLMYLHLLCIHCHPGLKQYPSFVSPQPQPFEEWFLKFCHITTVIKSNFRVFSGLRVLLLEIDFEVWDRSITPSSNHSSLGGARFDDFLGTGQFLHLPLSKPPEHHILDNWGCEERREEP
ncbi:hypothetical protein ABKN59_007832 [Abortiporus biennis]